MTKYLINITETGKFFYEIEADNAEDAYEKWLDGGHERIDRNIYDVEVTSIQEVQ